MRCRIYEAQDLAYKLIQSEIRNPQSPIQNQTAIVFPLVVPTNEKAKPNCFPLLFEGQEPAAARLGFLDTRRYHNYEARAQSRLVCSFGAEVAEADRSASTAVPGLVCTDEPGVETSPAWETD